MNLYEQHIQKELRRWQRQMQQRPSVVSKLTKRFQDKYNSIIPEKIHQGITMAIEKMVKAVLFGAKYTSPKIGKDRPLEQTEELVFTRIKFYRSTATAEGAVTGAGGILMGLADFPLLLGIKFKLLFDMAALYGFDVKDYKERLYILHVFQLAYSSQSGRNEVYRRIADWKNYAAGLPDDVDALDWRTFQQEYRDYIDLAKMAQLIPVIGAAVGAIVNFRLVKKLGTTAMNCYRMRWEFEV